jgi:molecular chaperone DnaK
VFDWGGGTLDISVLKLLDNRVFELATMGISLAGDDIDNELARAVHSREFKKRGDERPFDNMVTRDQDQLRTRCEIAKCEMSSRDQTEILVQNYGGQEPLDFLLTRQFFDALVNPFVNRAIELLVQAVFAANISFEALDGLLVIGGTSNLRLLRERLLSDDRFNSAIESSEGPEWDVALGAAVVDRMPTGYEVVDSVGLVLCDETFHPLVHPGEKAYSSEKTVSVSLVEDASQANIVLAKCDSATGVGLRKRAFQFQVPTAGFDGERIELAYVISEDLTFRVKARSQARGQSYEVMHEYEDLRFAYHIEQ